MCILKMPAPRLLASTPHSKKPPPDAAPLDWSEAHAQRFADAMNDDFNTPIAIAVLFDLVTEVNRHHSSAMARQLKKLGAVLGLLVREPQAFLQGVGGRWPWR
jgi:cysteinyl-tRNA synthetase